MAKKKKVKRFVLDVNVYISLFLSRKEDWLLSYIRKNKIEIFIDGFLLIELLQVLEYPHIKRLLHLDKFEYYNFVRYISTYVDAQHFDSQSPDPADDYLYDIALTAKAKFLVTNENALLNWVESPVETITLASFRYYFTD